MAATSSSYLLENLLLFPRVLRAAGLPVALEQSRSFVEALSWIDVGSREQVFCTARSLLVTRHEDLRLFEAVFQRFFRGAAPAPGRGQQAPRAPRHEEPHRPLDIATLMAARAAASDPEVDVADRSATYSPSEVLQQKEFSAMTAEELEAVKRLMASLRWRMSRRRTRRLVAGDRGAALDLRRALRQAARQGCVLRLHWRRPKVKQRPVVLLADISGSMERYARLVLQFFHSVCHSLQDVEAFVFATRLSRITPELRLRNIDRAVAEASQRVVDWAGGTRIGDSLAAFNRRFARRVLRRGAVVVLISDGWERGETSQLRREMAALQRRCHRLIWLNPLLGRATYEPRVEGMAAALPFVDDFLPIHNLDSLEQLAEHLAALPERRSCRRQAPMHFESPDYSLRERRETR